MSGRRSTRAAVVWVAAASLLTGCGFGGLHDVSLPGGAGTGDDAYRVTAEFRDVLDLVPQSAVKVNNVTVGTVEDIELRGWHAEARLRVSGDVKLPGNAVAEIRQTSMLGEKYVALDRPPQAAPRGRLADGARIPLPRTGRNAEVEEVLSALSALLNGGGVGQLKVITRELNDAMEGREDRIPALLRELDTFLGGLDEQRHEIVRAIKGLDKLGRTLAKEEKTIGRAVDELPKGLKVLADQRRNLTKMLRALSRLGTTGTRVINASSADLVANLRHLSPILGRLNEAGDDLPNALELLTTYPFPRNVSDAVKGDFVNLKLTADLDVKSLYGNLTPEERGDGGSGGPDSGGGRPELPGDGLPGLPDLPDPELPGGDDPDPEPSDEPGGGDGPLCPPVCLSSYQSSSSGAAESYPPGVDGALAELLTRGLAG